MSTKILVVDDEEDLRTAIVMMLSNADYEVCQASDGAQGVEVFCREQPDLVIMDVMMPQLDGFSACRAIR